MDNKQACQDLHIALKLGFLDAQEYIDEFCQD